ncbi:MAG TPA: pyrroline-5-carboxylate reductase [Candidatus Eisenbergiella merdipullorum]|uniref:Pyrroline-5-carboxylate reductase n=1 Tax=Candidatus Eisenbergiella merdipullorum TaxID=2838553 RepID=A0A9D2I6J2_9FIRM|nr:pyrroline-5-carboxylate reductase [Candidatus Eisenbergiella merdipullorum]
MKKKIGFIGLGNMASAMIGGMLKEGLVEPQDIVGNAKTEKSRQKAREKYGIDVLADNTKVAEKADIIVLAVKPQFFDEVIGELKVLGEEAWQKKLLISLAPGKTVAWFQESFGFPVPMIRCMPNTPALVGEGCTGMCASDGVPKEAVEEVKRLTDSFGRTVMVPERLMDVVSAVSGSSPAFVFLFIEAMADGAVAEGMPRAQAYEMAAQAVMGSAKMVLETGMHPGELKDMVCSPGGTTIQGVRALEEKNFRGAAMDAICACVERSKKL